MIISVVRSAIPADLLGDYIACAVSSSGRALMLDDSTDCYRALAIRRRAFDAKKPAAPPRAPRRSRGLGDTIAKATAAVGIKPCGGCKRRQAAFNRLLPYAGPADDAKA